MDGPKSQTRFLTMREELAATQAELARYRVEVTELLNQVARIPQSDTRSPTHD